METTNEELRELTLLENIENDPEIRALTKSIIEQREGVAGHLGVEH